MRSAETIRVLLADDHPALRMGLRVLLEQTPEINVVADVGDGRDALARIETLQPDVAVLDCQLPGMEGTAVAAQVRRRGLPVRVLALSAYADERYIRGMIEAGAVGYLLKEEAPGTIVAAVKAAAWGQGWFSPAVATKIAAWAQREMPVIAKSTLKAREHEILRLVVAGKTNKEIAVALRLSEKMVEKHLGELFIKLNVVSRVELAVLAVREGLV